MNWARLHDPLLLLYAGLAIDALFGEMEPVFGHFAHPVVLAGRAIQLFETRLNRQNWGDVARRLYGVVTVIVLIGLAAALGWLIHVACRTSVVGAPVEAFVVGVLLAQRSLYNHVAAVCTALIHGGVVSGRLAVSQIVGRDPDSLDGAGIARAAIESLAENFSDGVMAPAFWYLVAGLPGIFAYKMANTLDSMIGHKSPRFRAFGWAAARLDDLLNLVPAPLTGLLLAVSAIFDRQHAGAAALRIMLRDGRKHRSPNAGWPEAAMAGALGISLAGPRSYHGETIDEPYLGDGSPIASPQDINRALALYFRACVILSALVLAAFAIRHLMLLG